MATRNVSLSAELDRDIDERVRCGQYETASEVVRAALRALKREEELQTEMRLAWIDKKLAEGEASGVFEGDPFEAAYEELGLRPKATKRRKRG